MNINSKSFGLAVAVTAAFLLSTYSLGDLALNVLVIALVDGADYVNLSNLIGRITPINILH